MATITQMDMEITPQDAREISRKHPNKNVQRLIARAQENILEEARRGRRKAFIAYIDDYDVEQAAEHFRSRGFDVRVGRECCGGVWQTPAYYIYW